MINDGYETEVDGQNDPLAQVIEMQGINSFDPVPIRSQVLNFIGAGPVFSAKEQVAKAAEMKNFINWSTKNWNKLNVNQRTMVNNLKNTWQTLSLSRIQKTIKSIMATPGAPGPKITTTKPAAKPAAKPATRTVVARKSASIKAPTKSGPIKVNKFIVLAALGVGIYLAYNYGKTGKVPLIYE